MAVDRSFTDYIAKRFDNNFWAVAEQYLNDNQDALSSKIRNLHCAGDIEITDVKVEHIWVEDCPSMRIMFDVALSIWYEVTEGNHHYDNSEDNIVWMMARCKADLDCNLDDFEIYDTTDYCGKNRVKNPMDDSLVPVIYYEKLEDVAEDFLKENFPAALRVPFRGQAPVWVDPTALAEQMGLTIKSQRIKEDASIFGQIFFEDTDTELYDENTEKDILTHIDGKTIVVDPQMYLLRNLGSINNTIIHECVHWNQHRKAFRLEQLYNKSASCISCEVVGGAAAGISKKATEFMEKQANQLAPRIQMPREPFTAKAKEYITYFIKTMNAKHTIDVMEPVIDSLAVDFGVSRQAAKIRMVELGFEEAVGTFTYVDGNYVRPHSFKKDSLKINQTYTISGLDAALQRFSNLDLREKTANGDYLFIDNHYVYNAPLYVMLGEDGELELTDYARAHMDECCLVFDMSISSKVESTYHTACYLNREPSDITFDITFHNGYQNSPPERQVAMRKKQQEEWMSIRKQMTDDPEQCMDLLLKWRNTNYTELGDIIGRDPKTISRTVKSTTNPSVDTAVLICFGMNLPPTISEKLLEVLNCRLKPMDSKHQWLNEALHLKYPEPIKVVRRYLKQYDVII